MDRRSFLKSITALAAAAASMPSLASVIKPNKYAESLRLLDACRGINDYVESTKRIDALLAHLQANFTPPKLTDENKQACRQICHNPVDIAGIRSIPPTVADEIYPIAIIKLGLTAYKIQVDISLSKNFKWFHKEYGPLVISTLEK